MAGFASRSELLQRRSMASTGPPAGRPPRREGQQQWPDTSSGGPVTEAGRTVTMPEQDLDGLVPAITARLHADLARFCVLPGSEGHCSWTAPADTLSDLGMHLDLLSRCCSSPLRSARRRDVVLERTYASRLSGMG
jgi:hypothetical protein